MVGCAGSAQPGGGKGGTMCNRRKETLALSEKIGYALEQSENLVTKSVPGPRQFLVISEATEGVKWAGQKRFFSMERNANGFKLMESARLAVKKIKALGNARIEIDPRNEFYVVAVATAISLWLMSRQYRSLGDPTFPGGSMKKLQAWKRVSKLNSGKSNNADE
uniref:Uncharacterized protein n=1 Tax=Oryza nivara TaxID=4536 RepID=A0A0E0HW28_ORYNI